MSSFSRKTELSEKDELLPRPRSSGQVLRGPVGINLRVTKTLVGIVGAVCVVSGICIFAAVVTNSNAKGTAVLRQSAPGTEASVQENENPMNVIEVQPAPQLPVQDAQNETPAQPTAPEEVVSEVQDEPEKAADLAVSTAGSTENPTSTTQTSSTTRRRRIFDIFNRRSSDPTVRTSLGRLTGVNLTSRAGREYFGFYNVPYAEPPLGDLRFMPPVPVKRWRGTRNATVMGTMCVQKSRYNPDVDVEGTEDCLHTNIFTPKIPGTFERIRYPVIVYFFGGAFMHGTANDFNVDYFMDEDVILVIVEFRNGALGFLNTGDSTVTGNMGLKDQNLALKWVKDNIADFGGDPNKVVAFGSSSGAMCAHAHLLSPMSNGLMSGVISFSGSMLIPGESFNLNPQDTARELGIAMNCTEEELNNSTALVACLRNASYHDIALNQPTTFGPSIETIPEDGDTSNVFFSDTPVNMVMQGNANKVPWLVGVNSAEAILQSYSLLLDENATSQLNTNFNEVARNMLAFNDEDEVNRMLDEIRDFYFGNNTIDKQSETRYNLTNLLGDRFYYHPIKVAGLQHAQLNNVYWYYLTKEANRSFADDVIQYFDPPYGVSHADEVQYVFFRPRYPYIPLDSPWAEFSKMFVKFLVSFADTGAPVNPDANGVAWTAVNPSDNGKVWYNLDDTPKFIEPFTERLELWDSFSFDILYNSSSTGMIDMVEIVEDETGEL